MFVSKGGILPVNIFCGHSIFIPRLVINFDCQLMY
jgi:hypothetical protein